MYHVSITVSLKEGVSDPEGVNTLKVLHLLGFDQVKQVKTVRTFDLQMDGENKKTVEQHADQMCQKLLTNPIIHSYTIHVQKD